MFGNSWISKKLRGHFELNDFNMLERHRHLARPMQYNWHERHPLPPHNRRNTMSTLYNSFGRNVMALMAALLIGTTFVVAATGPAMVTPAVNNDIIA
jgi:hypothetical protein